MAKRDDLLYNIFRFGLIVCTIIEMVCLVIGLIDGIDAHRKAGFFVWLALFLIVSLLGFWGAYKEDFWYTMIFLIVILVFACAGTYFGTYWWGIALPVVTILFAAVFCFLLYQSGHVRSRPFDI